MTTTFSYSHYYLNGDLIANGRPQISNFTGIIKCHTTSLTSFYKNGKRHREEGPALEWEGGTKEYFYEGKRHRIDGPAIDCKGSCLEYWIHGSECTEEQHKLFVDLMKVKGLL